MERITYLVTGDWELESSRLPEAEDIVSYLLDTILGDETIDGVILTGDIFREYNSRTIEFARTTARVFRDALATRRLQLSPIFLVGNHDREIGVDRLSAIFRPEFHVISEPYVKEVGGHLLAFLPAPDRAQFGAGREAEGSRTRDERLSEALDAALLWLEQEAASKLAPMAGNLLPTKATIATSVPLLFHATVNSTIFNGSALSKGLTWTIDSNRIESFGAAIGGHIHKPSQFSDNGYYAGGIYPIDFGEKAINYQAIKLTLTENGKIVIDSIALPKIQDMIETELTAETYSHLRENGFAVADWLIPWIESAGIIRSGKFSAKIRCQLPKSELDLLPSEETLSADIRQEFPGLKRLMLKKEPVGEHKIRLTLDQPADTLSLLELVDKWNEVSGGTADDGALKYAAEVLKSDPLFEEWSSTTNQGFEPIRTEIKNFRQWTGAVIDWEGLHGAVSITGDNATGKTNFAEAPLFALYKKTPSSPDTLDDELRHGAEAGYVIQTFRSGGRKYKISRALERNSKGAVSCKSEFFELIARTNDLGLDVPILVAVCEKATEIDKAVAQIVGQREFVEATFYGTQDQIDALIVATPAIWHKRIRESLGLERFEDFREYAGKMKRNWSDTAAKDESRLDELKGQIVTKEAKVREFDLQDWTTSNDNALHEKDEVELEITGIDGELKEIAGVIEKRTGYLATIDALEKERDRRSSDFVANERKFADIEERIEALGEAPEIKLGENIESLDMQKATIWKKRQRQLEIWKEKKETSIEFDREIQLRAGRMESLTDNDNTALERIAEIRETYEKRIAEREALDAPPCDGMNRLGDDGDKAGGELRDICPAWIDYSNGETIELLKKNAEKERERLNDNAKAQEKLKAEVVELEKRQIEVKLIWSVAEDMANELQSELDDIIKAKEIEQKKEIFTSQLAEIVERNQALDKRYDEIRAELATIADELKKSEEVYQLQKDFERRIAEARIKLKEVEKAIADNATEFKLHEQVEKELADLNKRADELNDAIQTAGFRAAGWSLLESAFHSTGIPFLLMERTIPALEETANELLEGTDLSLVFSTEKLKKSDKKLKDEINVRFRDDRGEFQLRSASGYQRAVLSFAARFALAKVGNEFWSRRPKVFIQDEGWGRFNVRRYDTARRLIEKVSKVFDRFVYITHVDELADVADIRIRTEIVDGVSKIVEQ